MGARYKYSILVLVASSLGNLIGWIDSRPTWDDTGITVAMILCVTAFLGFAAPHHPWISGLLLGIWIPIWNISHYDNYVALFALAIAFAGAYLGALIRRPFLHAGRLTP